MRQKHFRTYVHALDRACDKCMHHDMYALLLGFMQFSINPSKAWVTSRREAQARKNMQFLMTVSRREAYVYMVLDMDCRKYIAPNVILVLSKY